MKREKNRLWSMLLSKRKKMLNC